MAGSVGAERFDHLALREQPGRQHHVERPALPENVAVAVRGVLRTEHRLEMRRSGGGGQELVRAGEREAVGPHLAGRRRMPGGPLDRVVAVLPLAPRLVAKPGVLPLRPVTTPFVLDHRDVAAGREVLGGAVRAIPLVVRRPLDEDRKRAGALPPREVDVGREPDAVAHRRHDLLAGPRLRPRDRGQGEGEQRGAPEPGAGEPGQHERRLLAAGRHVPTVGASAAPALRMALPTTTRVARPEGFEPPAYRFVACCSLH